MQTRLTVVTRCAGAGVCINCQWLHSQQERAVQYTNSGVLRFCQLLDDFSGPSARIQREFVDVLSSHLRCLLFPGHLEIVPALTLTLGLRYEIFASPRTRCVFGVRRIHPDQYLVPNRVNVVITTWPGFRSGRRLLSSGWLAKLFGDRKTVRVASRSPMTAGVPNALQSGRRITGTARFSERPELAVDSATGCHAYLPRAGSCAVGRQVCTGQGSAQSTPNDGRLIQRQFAGRFC
jgi:hypothetical protein